MFALLLAFFVSSAFSQSNPDPQNATVFALLYGYPLLAWQRAFSPVLSDVGANVWEHSRRLSVASDRTVVKPNVDTLYSRLIYDLSQSNVEIAIPEVPVEEFKLFSFYDPFGDNYANVGTGGLYKPGKYLLRPYDRPGCSSEIGLQMNNGSLTGYVGTVSSPTLYGYLLVRWGVNATNTATIHGWQDECESEVLAASKNLTDSSTPTLQSLVEIYSTEDSPAENVMNLLAKYAPNNGPSDQFEAAGISDGKYTPVSSVNLTAANATAIEMVTAAARDPKNIVPENNDWTVLSPKYIGVWGTNYALRTLIAQTGYLALADPYAVYPAWANASSGSATALLYVASHDAILFTFSGKPPLQEAGFWSLTAYGSDYFLIPNNQNVLALGDRSNLTYPDGSPVYETSADSSDGNERFQILLQPADVPPPANWTSNWLPAPSGGGDAIAQLRFFVAEDALTDGSYQFPVVEKIAAIQGGNGTNEGRDVSPATGAAHSGQAGFRLAWVAVLATTACIVGDTLRI